MAKEMLSHSLFELAEYWAVLTLGAARRPSAAVAPLCGAAAALSR